MKKSLLIILLMTATLSVFAQSQLTTIRGKTKDGKTIKIDYYKGAAEDYIENVKYQVVDELQSKVDVLQKELGRVNKSIEEQKKTIADLNGQIMGLGQDGRSSDGSEVFMRQIAGKEAEIEMLKEKAAALNLEVQTLKDQIAKLNGQLYDLNVQNTALAAACNRLENINKSLEASSQKLLENNEKQEQSNQKTDQQFDTQSVGVGAQAKADENLALSEKKAFRDSLIVKEETIRLLNATLAEANQRLVEQQKDCEKQMAAEKDKVKAMTRQEKASFVGLSVAAGPAFVCFSDLDAIWAKIINMGGGSHFYYGTQRLAENFSVSMEIGAGVHWFKTDISIGACQKTIENQTDVDGNSYNALYSFSDMKEALSLTYFDIPVAICFGQPARDRITAYLSVGLMASIKVNGKFEGEGTYSLKGYYPQWDVTLENISELGFENNVKGYEGVNPELKSFNLYGSMAFGTYIPIGCLASHSHPSDVVLKAGLKCEGALLPLSSEKKTASDKAFVSGKSNLLLGNPRVLIPMVELGFIYILR